MLAFDMREVLLPLRRFCDRTRISFWRRVWAESSLSSYSHVHVTLPNGTWSWLRRGYNLARCEFPWAWRTPRTCCGLKAGARLVYRFS